MQNKIKIFSIAAIILFASFAISDLKALEAPALTGRVNDYAGMLSAETKSSLEVKLAELENSDSTQIVVLTIPSLEGDALENFSIRVADKWKIGRKKLDNGAILLIAKEDRAVRIEVGYGLEGKLTDLISGRIISNIITPNFRNGDYDTGILKGVDAMASVVRGEFTAEDLQNKSGRQGKSSGNFLFIIIFLVFIIGALGSVKRIFGGLLGAAIFPIAGLFLLPLGIWILLLIPIGFLAGLIIPIIFSLTGFGRGGGFHGGGGFGGFSGGSFGGGGFSGGGGGFGGGGASGRW